MPRHRPRNNASKRPLKSVTPQNVAFLITKLFLYFRKCIVADPHIALVTNLSQFWNGVVLRTIQSFQDLIQQETISTDSESNTSIHQATLKRHFRSFTRQAIGLFHHILANLCLQYQLPRHILDMYYIQPPNHLLSRTITPKPNLADESNKCASLIVYAKILIYLGQLTNLHTSSTYYYTRALRITPDNGTPWFEQASVNQSNCLSQVSMLVRCLLTAVTNPAAHSNLVRTLTATIAKLDKELESDVGDLFLITLPLAHIYLGQMTHVSTNPNTMDSWSHLCLAHLDKHDLMGLVVSLIGYRTIGPVSGIKSDKFDNKYVDEHQTGLALIQMFLDALIYKLVEAAIECTKRLHHYQSSSTTLPAALLNQVDKVFIPLRTSLLADYVPSPNVARYLQILANSILHLPKVVHMVLGKSSLADHDITPAISKLPNVALPDDLTDLIGLKPFADYLKSIVPAVMAIDLECQGLFDQYGFRGLNAMTALHESRLTSLKLDTNVVRIGRLISTWQAIKRCCANLPDSHFASHHSAISSDVSDSFPVRLPSEKARFDHLTNPGVSGFLELDHHDALHQGPISSQYEGGFDSSLLQQSLFQTPHFPLQLTAGTLPSLVNGFTVDPEIKANSLPVPPLRLPAWSRDGLFENDEFDPTIALPIDSLSIESSTSHALGTSTQNDMSALSWATYHPPHPYFPTHSATIPTDHSQLMTSQSVWSSSNDRAWTTRSISEYPLSPGHLSTQTHAVLSSRSNFDIKRNPVGSIGRPRLRPYSPLDPPTPNSDAFLNVSTPTANLFHHQSTGVRPDLSYPDPNSWALNPVGALKSTRDVQSHLGRSFDLDRTNPAAPMVTQPPNDPHRAYYSAHPSFQRDTSS